MNFSSVRKVFSRRKIVSGLAELILMATPILMAKPMTATAGEPYNQPDGVAGYRAYPAQYGQPMPPPPPYPGTSDYAQRNQLQAQLNYAEAQYDRARQAGDGEGAKHWKKDIKHLERELYGSGHAEGSGYGAPAYTPAQEPSNRPPASAYAAPTQEYGAPGPAYAQPYPPTMPPYGYAGGAPAPYPPAGYPPQGYPNAAAGSPYGAPASTGPTGGLSSLVGRLFGGSGAPSAAPPYPPGGYPQAGYPNPPTDSPYGAPATTGPTGGLSSLVGQLFGGGGAPSAAPPYPPGGYPQAGYPNPAAGSPYGAPATTGPTGGLSSLVGRLFGGGGAPSVAPPYPPGGYPQAGYGSVPAP